MLKIRSEDEHKPVWTIENTENTATTYPVVVFCSRCDELKKDETMNQRNEGVLYPHSPCRFTTVEQAQSWIDGGGK